jgi:hypothetical protein
VVSGQSKQENQKTNFSKLIGVGLNQERRIIWDVHSPGQWTSLKPPQQERYNEHFLPDIVRGTVNLPKGIKCFTFKYHAI